MNLDDSQSNEDEGGWIQWFCNLNDNVFLCQIDQDYIKDSFNLYGIKQHFLDYKQIIPIYILLVKPLK